MNVLEGKKSYIIAVAAVLVGAINHWFPEAVEILNSPITAWVFGGAGLAALRAGVTKLEA